jgi:hypothetical protein
METFWIHNVTWKSGCFPGPERDDTPKNSGIFNSGKWGAFLGVSVQLFGRLLRDNSLGRPEKCCNLNEILILWASGV